jgi:ATP-dependent exoDNAse (exonuclease V) alpha subunit
LITHFALAHGRQPTRVEVLELRRRATLETRPAKEHHGLAEMTGAWRTRAERYVGVDQISWVAGMAGRNDLPLLRPGDLVDGILDDAAGVAVYRVAERRATFSRANVVAEVHRQLHGVRFASPEDRITVAERTADLALAQSLLISAPELHHTPERLRRADGTSRFRAKGHEVYTTATLLEAEARLLEAGRQTDGPVVTMGNVVAVAEAALPGRDHRVALDQAVAVEQIATSGRKLDVLVGPAGTGKSTTMAGLRVVWETQHGAGSVLGLAPSAGSAEVLATELGIDTENLAKWLYEHRQETAWLAKIRTLHGQLRSLPAGSRTRTPLRQRITAAEDEAARWRLRAGQLVIVDEASLAGTFALDELVSAAATAGAKVVLVGDQGQLSSVEAGGMFAALVRDRAGFAPELTDVHRFHHAWEKRASVELRAGSPDAVDAYEDHERISDGDREQMLDALYLAWRKDTKDGQRSLMIAGDLATVSELNARARADRVTEGAVADLGVEVAGGGTAGVGDLVVTRQNDRRLCTGQRWVRNGDRWTVTAIDEDGAMTVQRANGGGTVVLPAAYVAEYVELAYASSAHRAQGRTVDTAHAFVTSTTTREALYVLATRGRESNRLYVDTHYDPDPQTAHDHATEPVTAKEVLTGVLRNEGADVAAHEMIRRQQSEAEGMERLSAEYLTLATMAQADRWDSLLTQSGLSDGDLAAVWASAAHGPLLAAFREAEARGLDVEATLPRLVTGRSLADAGDVAAVLHGRVERWTQAASGRSRRADNLIAGLIPRAQGVSDPEMAQALAERDHAMEERARTLAEQAVETGEGWAGRLGTPPTTPARQERWMRELSTVAAYRDRWHVTGQSVLGEQGDASSLEQTAQRQLAQTAAARAMAISDAGAQNQNSANLEVELQRGVEL